MFSPKTEMDPILSKTKKSYALRISQLKVGHEAIGTFFKRIGATKTAKHDGAEPISNPLYICILSTGIVELSVEL